MLDRTLKNAVIAAGAFGAMASNTWAVPTTIIPVDTPGVGDTLVLPTSVHELGNAPGFPIGERITTTAAATTISAYALTDLPLVANVMLTMTNNSPTSWINLHYVGDVGTVLTNDDGLVTGGLAFRIDAAGVNTPLRFESMHDDGVFEPGETWRFIIQDYTNTLLLSAAQMGSLGVGTTSAADTLSSGSIVATLIPAPGSFLALALAGAVNRRRRRA